MPSNARRALYVLVLAPALLVPAGTAAASCRDARAQALPDVTAHAIRCALTAERRAAGLRRLRPSARLTAAADRQLAAITASGVFAHRPPGVPALPGRLRAARYPAAHAAENLFWASGASATAQATVRGWLASPGHRAAALGAFRHIGVAVAPQTPSGEPGLTVVAVFGRLR